MTVHENCSVAPLDGLRVLDLSTMIAAPVAASMLADYGAEVVKLERPVSGDFVRRFGAQKQGEGLYWKSLSRNKTSVAVDLHSPEAQALLRKWIPQFDVLIENFRPGTLERWGLSPTLLREVSPHLIILRVTAYGQTGPYSERPGFGTLAEAMTGLAAVSGFPDRPPLLPSVPLADIMAGQLGAAAVLAALNRRRVTGDGDCIDLAIYESALKLVELNVLEYDQLGVEQQRSGNRIGSVAPRGSYECYDHQWLALSGSTQPVAERVLRTIGGEGLVRDPRFATNSERVQHSDELDDLISAWCKTRDRESAISEFTRMGCAVGPLETVESMLVNPQVVARGSITSVPDTNLGEVRMANIYPQFESGKCRIRSTGPAAVGQHTDDVLRRDLGLSTKQLRTLHSMGVLGSPSIPARSYQQDPGGL
jgi:crotonobetainyl-CoA:carnitine CoA-transferase CaiB-like acyl-CoA transferase